MSAACEQVNVLQYNFLQGRKLCNNSNFLQKAELPGESNSRKAQIVTNQSPEIYYVF